jgi:hypothetical protein
MRVGIIIRSTHRGLATQTQEAWRGYPFDAALHIVDGDPKWPEDQWEPHRPDDIHRAQLVDGDIQRDDLYDFLTAVDLVFSVETLYSPTLVKLLEYRSMRSVVQGNCELWGPFQQQTRATKWVWPTPWRLPDVPEGPTLPVPVANECNATAGGIDDRLVVVHPAGHRAVGDRNGTELVMGALSLIKVPVTIRLYCQDGEGAMRPPRRAQLPPNVEIEVHPASVDDRWSMYDGAHAVLLPRRYGGLCLPAQEALQAGVIPLMTNCEPNNWWPIIRIPASKGRGQRVRYGSLETWVANPRHIARRIDELHMDRQRIADGSKRALEWAQEHTWERLSPMYTDLFNSRL